MPSDFLHPGGIVAMSRQAVKRLLQKQDGRLALLYLSLLSNGDDKAITFQSETEREEAYKALASIGLWESNKKPEAKPEKIDVPPPEYTQSDILHALEEEPSFTLIVGQIEQMLGKKLSTADLHHLLFIFDYLSLPAEVIMLLTTFCIERTVRQNGEGRRPTLAQIKKEALYWSRQGVETLEQAELQLKKAEMSKEWERQVLTCIGVRNRPPVAEERKFINAWADMGFNGEVISLAYERTIMQLQNMNWKYMHGILKRWHKEGLMTKADIEAKESSKFRGNDVSFQETPKKRGVTDVTNDFDRLDKLLEKKKGE